MGPYVKMCLYNVPILQIKNSLGKYSKVKILLSCLGFHGDKINDTEEVALVTNGNL